MRLMTARTAWIIAWLGAAYMMYNCVIGKDWYLPIYFARLYLTIFAAAILLHRFLSANRYTEKLSSFDLALLLFGGIGAALVAAYFAPAIGERNYCGTWFRFSSLGSWRVPPRVFRCTPMPIAFVVFVAGTWIVSWAMLKRPDSSNSDGPLPR